MLSHFNLFQLSIGFPNSSETRLNFKSTDSFAKLLNAIFRKNWFEMMKYFKTNLSALILYVCLFCYRCPALASTASAPSMPNLKMSASTTPLSRLLVVPHQECPPSPWRSPKSSKTYWERWRKNVCTGSASTCSTLSPSLASSISSRSGHKPNVFFFLFAKKFRLANQFNNPPLGRLLSWHGTLQGPSTLRHKVASRASETQGHCHAGRHGPRTPLKTTLTNTLIMYL